jgi:hypothetical protein
MLSLLTSFKAQKVHRPIKWPVCEFGNGIWRVHKLIPNFPASRFNRTRIHRNSIHKSTVVAVEIDDLILLAHLLDHAMFARDHGVDKAQLIRFVTVNRCLATDQLSNSPCQRTRDGEEPRLHRSLPCVKV